MYECRLWLIHSQSLVLLMDQVQTLAGVHFVAACYMGDRTGLYQVDAWQLITEAILLTGI